MVMLFSWYESLQLKDEEILGKVGLQFAVRSGE